MGRLSFSRYQKDTLIMPVRLEAQDGSAIDLTDAEILFALADYDESSAGVTIDRSDAAGEFTVSVHYDLMDDLVPGKDYRFGIVLIWPDDIRTTIIDGHIALLGKAVS